MQILFGGAGGPFAPRPCRIIGKSQEKCHDFGRVQKNQTLRNIYSCHSCVETKVAKKRLSQNICNYNSIFDNFSQKIFKM